MAEKVKQTGIIIAIIAGITLPTLAIAWVGGGRLATVEVVAKGARDGVNKHTEEIKALTRDLHKAELLQMEINTKLNAIPRIEKDVEKLTEHLLKFDYNRPKDK